MKRDVVANGKGYELKISPDPILRVVSAFYLLYKASQHQMETDVGGTKRAKKARHIGSLHLYKGRRC